MRRWSGTVPRATFADSISTQSLELRTTTSTLTLSFASLRQRRRKLADSKHASNYLTKRNRSKSNYSFSNLFSLKTDGALTISFIPRITPRLRQYLPRLLTRQRISKNEGAV